MGNLINELDSSNYELSIIIPMHNSESVIERTIQRWKEKLVSGKNEIVLVENGSTDRTWEIASELASNNKNVTFTTIRSPKGLGSAYKAGIEASSGLRILLSADDLPFDFNDIDQASALKPAPKIVIGSKAHSESSVERGLLRQIFTLGYRIARFLVLGSKIGDTQGTFYVDGKWLKQVNTILDEPGFLFTTQLVVLAESMGIEILEIPVNLSNEHAPKQSTVKWKDVLEMGTGLIKLRQFIRMNQETITKFQ